MHQQRERGPVEAPVHAVDQPAGEASCVWVGAPLCARACSSCGCRSICGPLHAQRVCCAPAAAVAQSLSVSNYVRVPATLVGAAASSVGLHRSVLCTSSRRGTEPECVSTCVRVPASFVGAAASSVGLHGSVLCTSSRRGTEQAAAWPVAERAPPRGTELPAAAHIPPAARRTALAAHVLALPPTTHSPPSFAAPAPPPAAHRITKWRASPATARSSLVA